MSCETGSLAADYLWPLGKTDQAAKAVEELKALSKQVYVSPTAFAPVYATMGDPEGAFDHLTKPFEKKSPDLPGEVLGHPIYVDKLGP